MSYWHYLALKNRTFSKVVQKNLRWNCQKTLSKKCCQWYSKALTNFEIESLKKRVNISLLLFRLSEKCGLFTHWVVFLFSQLAPIKSITCNKTFLRPTEDINYLSSNKKIQFVCDFFKTKSCKLAMLWINWCTLWRFYLWCRKSLIGFIYARRSIPLNKIFQNDLKKSNRSLWIVALKF